MWKIVGASEASVLYIYIYIDNNNNNHVSRDISHLLIESPIKRGEKRKISVIQGSN